MRGTFQKVANSSTVILEYRVQTPGERTPAWNSVFGKSNLPQASNRRQSELYG